MIDLEEYANRIGIPLSEIMSKSRLRELVTARQVYWFYLRSLGYGFLEIGRMFERNHSTVLQGVRTVENLKKVKDKYLKRFSEAIEYKNL